MTELQTPGSAALEFLRLGEGAPAHTLLSFCAASSTMRLPSAFWRRMGCKWIERAACCHMLQNCSARGVNRNARAHALSSASQTPSCDYFGSGCYAISKCCSISSSPAVEAARHQPPSTPNAHPSASQLQKRVALLGSVNSKLSLVSTQVPQYQVL